jgi:hypothetical protein
MSSRLRLAAISGCVLAISGPAGVSAAGERTAPSFLVRPVLVRSAGGAFVHYALDHRAVHARVSIAGHIARIRHEGGAKDFVYDAFVNDRRLRPGHYYRVSVTVTSRTGGVASRRELLYLHRSFPRR